MVRGARRVRWYIPAIFNRKLIMTVAGYEKLAGSHYQWQAIDNFGNAWHYKSVFTTGAIHGPGTVQKLQFIFGTNEH